METVTMETSWSPSTNASWDTTMPVTNSDSYNKDDEMLQVKKITELVSTVVLSLSAVLTFSNNLLTIIAVVRFRELQKRTNAFILSLTLSDFLNFFAIVAMLVNETTDNELATKILSSASIFIHVLSKFISLLTLLLIALDRYNAVIQPIKHRWKTTKDAVRTIAMCWFLGLSSPSIVVFHMVKDKNYDALLIAYIVPTWIYILWVQLPIWLIILSCIFLYCRVIHKIRRRLLKITELHAANCVVDGRAAKVIAENRRIIQMMAIILSTVIITWVPYTIFTSFVDSEMFETEPAILIGYRAISALIQFNSFINPLIYAWSSSAFKDAYLKLLGCKSNLQAFTTTT